MRSSTIAVVTAFVLLSVSATAAAFSPHPFLKTPHPSGPVLIEPTQLGRIVVEGNRLPLPVALEILKTALNNPWSTAWKDRNQIVCRLRAPLGTHVEDREGMYCETNNDFFQKLNALQAGWETGGPISVVETFDQPETVNVDPSRLRALLAKVPPAGSSYTLELTSHGKVVSEWVMKRGQLVKAWHLKPETKR